MINGIVADISVCLFHVSGVAEGRPVEKVVRIFIEAYIEYYLISKVYVRRTKDTKQGEAVDIL